MNKWLKALLCVGLVSVLGCGYSTRPGLPGRLKTVYVKPFLNHIDVTQLPTNRERYPVYRHNLEVDITDEVIDRYQFSGLLRPTSPDTADCHLIGELRDFRRDALRYDASQNVEEWRLSLVVDLTFIDQLTGEIMWKESGFIGDTTYFATGTRSESEQSALDRAVTDLARRIVERSVENW